MNMVPLSRVHVWHKFFRFELSFQLSKFDLRFWKKSNRFSRDKSFGHFYRKYELYLVFLVKLQKKYQWMSIASKYWNFLNTNNWIVSLKLYKCSRILPYCLSSAAIAQLSQPKTWLRLMGSFLAIDSVMSVPGSRKCH